MGISIGNYSQAVGTYQSTNISFKEQQTEKSLTKETSDEDKNSIVSVDGDVLTISETGKLASMNMSSETETESDSQDLTSDLSAYTETELKEMYLDGTINKSEYDEELESRES